jgi:hypothetical protein
LVQYEWLNSTPPVLDLTVKRLRNPKLAMPRVQLIRGEFSANAY